MRICEYLENLYYRWKYRKYNKLNSLVRSNLYQAKIKELLLEDLKAMKHTAVIADL